MDIRIALKEEGVVLNYLLAEPADCTRKNTVTEPANLVPIYRSRPLEDRAVTTTVGNTELFGAKRYFPFCRVEIVNRLFLRGSRLAGILGILFSV